MKKLITSLAITVFTITVIFLSCKKVENTTQSGDKVFIEQAKNWFNSSFVNTAEYKNGTANENIKTPNWKYGKTFTIGKIQFAEFPLIINRKKVYINENLTEADSRRIIENTKFKALFVKAPDKPMEVRIIQFTPSFNYLQSKNFNLKYLSFKDYTKEFKGDFMMFDFDNNFKKGYHFAIDGIKTIKLNPKGTVRNTTKGLSGPNASTTSEEFCDNEVTLLPGCTYIVYTTYLEVCSSSWNLAEGFNPAYCHYEILDIQCELQYCDGDGDLADCINAGGTQEECSCSVYGVGCGGGGGGGEEEQCASSLNDLANSASTSDETISITTIATTATTRTKNYEWKILTSWGGWYIFSFDQGVHEKDTNNLVNPWKWQALTHNDISLVGLVVGGSAEPSLISATPTMGIYHSVMEIKFKVKYAVVCSISPINYTLTYTSSKLFNVND